MNSIPIRASGSPSVAERPPPLAQQLRKAQFVINARAGSVRRDPQGVVSTVQRGAEAIGLNAQVMLAAPSEIADVVQAIASNPDVDIVVGGGDGTISAAVAALAGSNARLAVLPLGTLNLFARDVGMPMDLEAALRSLGRTELIAVDVGDLNGRRFAMHASLGAYPWMVRRRDRARPRSKTTKLLSMARAAVKATLSAPALEIDCEHDGGTESIRSYLVTVSVGRASINEPLPFTRGRLDEGKLFLYHANQCSRFRLVQLAAQAAVGLWPASKAVTSLDTTRLVIRSSHQQLPVAIDGEVTLEETPLRYRVLPAALQVYKPVFDDG